MNNFLIKNGDFLKKDYQGGNCEFLQRTINWRFLLKNFWTKVMDFYKGPSGPKT